MPTAARACPACSTPLPEEAQFCLQCGAATPTDPGAPPRSAPTGVTEVTRVQHALADRYRIERVLGEGGMATVYLAEDLKHQRQVAVKVMRPELAATLGADRFLREIQIAARLSHPHILPVHDSGEAAGFLYYVMPNVEGESVRDRIQRDGPLPVDEAVQLAREVAEALAYAHKRGIIHRDIKPANIMLGEGHALVADFGIARALGSEAALTGTGLAVGTPQYMSPEQAMGAKEVDARADVYAVGGVLYEMLAGRAPYTGETPQAILAKSLMEDVAPLATARPEVPAPVAAVVARAMARNPRDRHASAGELAAALAGALGAVRSGAIAPLSTGPSALHVWGLFGAAATTTLAVVYGLVRRWGLPAWTLALAVVLLVIGAAVLVATGRLEARRRTGIRTPGLARWFTWRNAAYGGGLAGGLWVAVALALVFRGPMAGAVGDVTRLVVLPFENLGASDQEYFADGITDEVRGKLSALPGMLVTARASSVQYKATTKTPQEIAKELGVSYLLTATVRWQGGNDQTGRVQVSPELIDASTGGVKWRQSFDAALTDVFRVQGEIATQVAQALNLALGAADRRTLGERPTDNVAAYDAYLRGEEISQSIGTGDPVTLRRSIQEYERAIAADSTFALAWAQLSRAHSRTHANSIPTPAQAEAALRAAERALALAPERAAGHLALGDYHRLVTFDFARALAEYTQGRQVAPGNADLLRNIAATKQSLGQWDASVADLAAAEALDPRSVGTILVAAVTSINLQRYAEAQATMARGLQLAPTNLSLIEVNAMIRLAQGDLPGARAVVRSALNVVERSALVAYFATYQDLYWVLDDEQQQLLLRLPLEYFDDNRGIWAMDLAQVFALRGDRARTVAYADSARLAFAEQLRDAPDDPQLPVLHALALAYMGRSADAIREGERAVARWPVSRDAVNSPYFQHQLVRIYILAGEHEKALDQLEFVLRVRYYLSPGWLRVDPTFAPLRGNPRFERLAAGSS